MQIHELPSGTLSSSDVIAIDNGTSTRKTTFGSFLKAASYDTQYTISANAGLNLTANDFGISTPSGYTPVAILQFSSGNASVYVRAVNAYSTGTNGVLYMNNTSSSAITATAYMQILYAKSVLL